MAERIVAEKIAAKRLAARLDEDEQELHQGLVADYLVALQIAASRLATLEEQDAADSASSAEGGDSVQSMEIQEGAEVIVETRTRGQREEELERVRRETEERDREREAEREAERKTQELRKQSEKLGKHLSHLRQELEEQDRERAKKHLEILRVERELDGLGREGSGSEDVSYRKGRISGLGRRSRLVGSELVREREVSRGMSDGSDHVFLRSGSPRRTERIIVEERRSAFRGAPPHFQRGPRFLSSTALGSKGGKDNRY